MPQTKTRKRKHRKITFRGFRDFRGFRVFDLAEKKLPRPEQLAWIGVLFPGTPEEHPTVLTTGPSNSVNPIPVKLHCQVI